jgi:hypothetical protein
VSERQKTGWDSNNAAALASVDVNSIPLRSIIAGAINMEVWVEESIVKAKLPG